MHGKWIKATDLKWSEDGKLMIRQDATKGFENAQGFFMRVGISPLPPNLIGCGGPIGPNPPTPDGECTSLRIKEVRLVAGGCEVKSPDGEVKRLDKFFRLPDESAG